MNHVVIGILRKGQHVLTAWREFSPPINARWEFPGGKRQINEDTATALRRELYEEINIEAEVGSLIISIQHDYGTQQILLDAHEIRMTGGQLRAREGQFLRWYPLEKLHPDDFPDANRGLLSALKLPDRYAIIMTQPDIEDVWSVNQVLKTGTRFMLLRGKAFTENSARAERIATYIRQQGAQFMLHDQPERVVPLQASGVHCSQEFVKTLDKRPVPQEFYFSVSCHSLAEVKTAESLGADFCVLGPIFPTPSHMDTKTLGMKAFESIVAQAKIPVFAIGGMDIQQIKTVRSHGGQGIAGIRCFSSFSA